MKGSSIIALFFLMSVVTSFIGCEQGAKKENIQLREKINKLQAENDSLKSIISEFEQTDDYYYQMAIGCRENKNYEKSNIYLNKMIERFPKSGLLSQARTLIGKNNGDIAQGLYDKAVSASNQRMYQYSSDLVDELIAKFPESSVAHEAKRLKAENKKKEKDWEQAQLREGSDLELLTWTWSTTAGGSYVEAKGQVKNISNRHLENVMAVVTFYDKNMNFVTSGDALIDFDPLLAGQKSPFSVHARYNPAIEKATVEFKFLMGGTIPTFYKR